MKTYSLLFLAVFMVLCVVKALECYHCEFIEGIDIEDDSRNFDKSCKSGRKPKKKFAITCPSGYDVCFKAFIEGRLNSGADIKDTVRSCGKRIFFPGYENDKCEGKNSTELSDLVGFQVPDNFKGNICLCSDDECNSSTIVNVSKVSNFVLLAFYFLNGVVFIR